MKKNMYQNGNVLYRRFVGFINKSIRMENITNVQ